VIRVRAFAKINLALQVVRVRGDGYHELRTIFQSLALHDTLTVIRRRGPFGLACDDEHCPADATNLVWRAAERAWRAAGRAGAPVDVRVRLTKRIPVQAGLGGGSSDAAAALRAFGRLWRVPEATLRRIGAELGADVPYFFDGGTCLGLGRGDRLTRLTDEPSAWVVLALPGFGVSTREAFAWYDRQPPAAAARAAGRSSTGTRSTGNDLERCVAERHPVVAELTRSLASLGARRALMTGSGSTVFGLFDRRSAAEWAASRLNRGRVRTLMTRTLDGASFRRRSRPELPRTS
jgi:4-diphosphocytidyl-2-C-methyl-D-erythritol kinase